MSTQTFAGSVLASPECAHSAAGGAPMMAIAGGAFNIARAHTMADNFGATITEHEFGITIEGRRFVNHLASLDELAAWFIGYQAALASVDLLFCARAVKPDHAASSVEPCAGTDAGKP